MSSTAFLPSICPEIGYSPVNPTSAVMLKPDPRQGGQPGTGHRSWTLQDALARPDPRSTWSRPLIWFFCWMIALSTHDQGAAEATDWMKPPAWPATSGDRPHAVPGSAGNFRRSR